MDSQQATFSTFTSKVSPCDKAIPESAWQEEESLEVYRKKRTQRPPSATPTEIVKCIKRQPKAGEEIYESVQPRHDGRRELILLEPVRFGDEPPETLYDDYSLYRMEEYVDAGTETCEHDKQPVYYALQKVEKETLPPAQTGKIVEEEVISPAKELDTITLREAEERESMERISAKQELRTAPPPSESTERGPYISRIPIGDGIEERSITHSSETERYERSHITEEQRSVVRGSEAGRSARPCSRCAELSPETTRETPILDRIMYYEREVVEDGNSRGRAQDSRRDSRASSRQAAVVDDEIADANRRVDGVFRSYETSKEARKLPTVPEEDFHEKQNERLPAEGYKETRKEGPPQEEYVVPRIRAPSRTSSRSSTERTQFYEKSVHGSPYRPTSTTRSAASPYYCPHCRTCSREQDRMYTHEPHTVRVVPIQKERYPLRTRHDNGREPLMYSAPIHETITTERFERIEKVKRVFPATAV
ncbi:unnamed protein product [Cylicocyclus nassatus]|uniref:Uncharacterized protein n=1 Tax=Cylicocyclus nassatus TaxID=53992 RepID=A0AA36H8L8_CYLNA|nr:unnamed protein product [Cylicocyclus nassatus]